MTVALETKNEQAFFGERKNGHFCNLRRDGTFRSKTRFVPFGQFCSVSDLSENRPHADRARFRRAEVQPGEEQGAAPDTVTCSLQLC